MTIASDDQVIEHVDPQQLAGLVELDGQCDISRGRRRIPGRVIVHDHNRSRILPDGILKNLADPHLRLIDAASINRSDGNDLMFGIDQHNPQLFMIERGHLRTNKPNHVFRRADPLSIVRIERHDSVGQLERRSQARRLCRSDSMDSRKL